MGVGGFVKEWGPTIASVGGSIASGIGKGQQNKQDQKMTAAQLAEDQKRFNAQFDEDRRRYNSDYAQKGFDQTINAQSQYGDRAQSVNRELEMLPMRDKASALLMQRMGAPAQQVQARSLAGGTASLAGGTQPQGMPYDLNAIRQQAANYKAGDGGMTGDVQKELLKRYMDVPKTPEMEQPKIMTPAEIDYAVKLKDRQLSQDAALKASMDEGHMSRGDIDRELQAYRASLEAGKNYYNERDRAVPYNNSGTQTTTTSFPIQRNG